MKRGIGVVILLLSVTISIEMAIHYQNNYAVPWAPPTKDGISQLTAIRQRFGYDNPNTIIVVRDISSYLWALAYSGGLIYYGNVLMFMTNHTDYELLNSPDQAVRNAYVGSIQKLWTYGVRDPQQSRYHILVPSALYQPDPIEAQALSAIGDGILETKRLPNSQWDGLLSDWNYVHSTGDILAVAAKYVIVNEMIDCTAFRGWQSTTNSANLSVEAGFKTAACSVHVSARTYSDSTLYVQLEQTPALDLRNKSYVGFYFRGNAITSVPHSLIILFATGDGFTSYRHYDVNDVALWDGRVHGLLFPEASFAARGSPNWGSISSIKFGIYSSGPGIFSYDFEYLVSASPLAEPS